ncbi:bifunctional methylenetetrahydrofolate dehydrogenase/cyclohydrolase, mitochondrial [Patella vulgata]|uniref:bifunctional methylenetetrahydrofolate dehydrogenase/cyclohydrolase, mitochondrial n=1 Tax=Patella vulgata TaxID=6465 RepID=UPI00217F6ABE|nr:bifunctional methylenetetrahydrofolate dehydrogenase/cyclohydrolase, mitochondrial [Patella vulgata]
MLIKRSVCVFTTHFNRNFSKKLLGNQKVQVGDDATAGFSLSHRCFHNTPRCNVAKLIDGKAIAKQIKDEVKAEVDKIISLGQRPPRLTVLLVGDNDASVVYVKNKIKAAQYTGIISDTIRLPDTVKEHEVIEEINTLNNDPLCDGLLVQLPVPPHITERRICDAVDPEKDVDGFNILNIGRFCVDEESFVPATPAGIMEMLRRQGVETFGKNAVVIGRSKNVGMPIAMYLHADGEHGNKAGDATVTICHRYTPPEQLKVFTKTADIIVSATGIPNLVTADMVKEGVTVIDVGITRITDPQTGKSKLVGDVDFEGVREKAAHITPVPGGVGPLTVAMLMKNTLTAYQKYSKYTKNT